MENKLFTNQNSNLTFEKIFQNKIKNANKLIIATGYFGLSTINRFKNQIIDVGMRGECKILIGMAFHGGLKDKQKAALIQLDKELRENNPKNGVYISIKPYHGKIYYFGNKTEFSIYVGSSNFSHESLSSRHECMILVEDYKIKSGIDTYLTSLLSSEFAKNIKDVEIPSQNKNFNNKKLALPLSKFEVPKSEFPDVTKALGVCKIFLRVDQQPNSSLNLFFDKGRKNPVTQLYTPRPWYEVEITSNKKEQQNEVYPESIFLNERDSNSRSGTFTAYAKDNNKYYKFQMSVASANGKAIATSELSGGRQTLGKFIKGKLERDEHLLFGTRITSDILKEYGKETLDLYKIRDGVYILDFDPS